MTTYLVTGTAGFIGFSLTANLLRLGHRVIGVDCFTPYYDVKLKRDRVSQLANYDSFSNHEFPLEDASRLDALVKQTEPEIVVHLAAQAGVRYSITNPRAYVDANLIGTFNVLEAARATKPKHLMIASTSSVYGANRNIPFQETDRTDHQLTLYAATKKACEVMAHSYSHLFNIPTSIFRFFSVYGPWGRPDMALFIFTRNIIEGRPIDIYNHGNMERDFTYVDDLVGALTAVSGKPPSDPQTAERPSSLDDDAASPVAPYRVVNIGLRHPVRLLDFISEIEKSIGRPAQRNLLPMQPGDVERTIANTEGLNRLVAIESPVPIEVGVRRFVDWYRSYYRV